MSVIFTVSSIGGNIDNWYCGLIKELRDTELAEQVRDHFDECSALQPFYLPS